MALSKKALRPLFVILLAVALIAVWRIFFSGDNRPADFIRATGVMEATEVNISSKTAARIEWLCCSVGDRLKANHRTAFVYDDKVVETIASRCKEVESGARNVDHIITGTLLPAISREFLSRMADGQSVGKVSLGVDAAGQFVYEFAG